MKKEYPASFILAAKLLVLVALLALAYAIKGVLIPLMFAVIIAINLYPVCALLERWRFSKAMASITAVILATLVLSGLIYFIVNQVIVIGRNGEDLSRNFIDIYDRIQQWISSQFGLEPGELTERLREQAKRALSNAGSYLTSAFSSAGGTLANAVLVPLYVFFFLYYRDFFKDFFIRANRSVPAEKTLNTLGKIYDVVQSYLFGLITVMGIVAVLNTAGLLVLGLEYAWFFGTLAAILILLPYIGIAIGSIIPAVFALATMDSYWYALGVVAWFQVVQFLEGNFITPNIVGGKISLNPLVAIISLLLGGMLFGLAGLILALPLVAVIKIVFETSPSTRAFSFLIGEPEKGHLEVGGHEFVRKQHNIKVEKEEIKSKSS